MRRYVPLKASRGTVWPADVRAAILDRDSSRCVCVRADFPPEVIANCPVYPVELDHIRASGGISMKSRSTVDNGVTLSAFCHRWKTEHGREARPLLLDWIARRESDCGHVDPRYGCPTCLGRAS
jgi:hypothetical protein